MFFMYWTSEMLYMKFKQKQNSDKDFGFGRTRPTFGNYQKFETFF